MLSELNGFQAIYIYCGKCDLRKGIDGLATLVKEQFHLDPFQKDVLFLFCGCRTDRFKGLVWEGDGFCLLYKRIEAGRLRWPRSQEEAGRKSTALRHLPPSRQEKGRTGQGKIQLQVCAVGYLNLRRMRPALSQTGMVKIRTEMGSVALRQPPEIRFQALQTLVDHQRGHLAPSNHGGHQQRSRGSGRICAGVPGERHPDHRQLLPKERTDRI